jgi:FAD/FMN-containing dehydrogenase
VSGPANELEVDVNLRRLVLRDFTYGVGAIRPVTAELVAGAGSEDELAAALEGLPVDGLELILRAADTGLQVSARFERSEFVNLATAGLALLDAADATELTEGGETL